MTEAENPTEPQTGKSWTTFYDATAGREVRPLLVRALDLIEAAGCVSGLAIDLGCGDGTDTLELLRRGWRVVAIDGSEEGIARTQARADELGLAGALEARHSRFEDIDNLPPAQLVYSAVSLPFCPPRHFGGLWRLVRDSVDAPPGGWLAVQLFGPRDTWAGDPDLNFHSRHEVEQLVEGLQVRALDERDEDGQAVSGPKHWHVFDVIAVATS